jgi:hypothetical protein
MQEPRQLKINAEQLVSFRKAAVFCLDTFENDITQMDEQTKIRIRSGDIGLELQTLMFTLGLCIHEDDVKGTLPVLKELVVRFYCTTTEEDENAALDSVRERLLIVFPIVCETLDGASKGVKQMGEDLVAMVNKADPVAIRRLTKIVCLGLRLIYFSND